MRLIGVTEFGSDLLRGRDARNQLVDNESLLFDQSRDERIRALECRNLKCVPVTQERTDTAWADHGLVSHSGSGPLGHDDSWPKANREVLVTGPEGELHWAGDDTVTPVWSTVPERHRR